MDKQLHKNISLYVQKVGVDKAYDTALKSISGVMFDMSNTTVDMNNLFLAIADFQINVLKYLWGDEDKIRQMVRNFSKEASDDNK